MMNRIPGKFLAMLKKTIMLMICFGLLTACAKETYYIEDFQTKKDNKTTIISNEKESADEEIEPDSMVDDGYSLVWSDEFEGDSLNLADWNVEERKSGWISGELQEYTALNGGNIQVKDGELHIIPMYNSGSTLEGNEDKKVISERSYDTYTIDIPIGKEKNESNTISFGINFGKLSDNGKFGDNKKALSSIANVTLTNLSLIDITDAENQSNLLSSGNFENPYDWSMVVSEPAKGYYDYTDGKLNLKIENAGAQNWHIQLQQWGLSVIPGHTYRLSMEAASDIDRIIEVAFFDPDNGYDLYGGSSILINGSGNSEGFTFSNGEIKSGRINTNDKHVFTYGRFEVRAKVPYGKGFLPAFWLMSTNENDYGGWPKCGEIDVMEIMGQETDKSYHTIHFGSDSGSGHKQIQGTYANAGLNYEDYHVFRLDWEPWLFKWYVDDQEVFRVNDWNTEGNNGGYPAPFDHDFYIILNLAFGGRWEGYPDYEALNDLNRKEFVIDYVRVYQKNENLYQEEISQLLDNNHN